MSRYLPVDTFNTGSIASEASEAFARSFGHNFLNIVKIKVTPSGSTVGYSVKVYKDAALTQELLATKDNVVGFFYAPTTRSGGEALEGFVAPYEDLDELGNLNIVITNHDAVSRSYDVEITCEVPAITGEDLSGTTISLGTTPATNGTIRIPSAISTVSSIETPSSQEFLGVTKSLADNVVTDLFTVAATSDGQMASGLIEYSVYVDSGTEIQVVTGVRAWTLYNNGGTIVSSTAQIGSEVQSLSSGTITLTWSQTNGGPGTEFELKVDSSLDFDSVIRYRLLNNSTRPITII